MTAALGQEELLSLLLRQQLGGGAGLPDGIAALAESDPQLGPVAELLAQREQQLQEQLERQEEEERRQQDELARHEEGARQAAARRERSQALRGHLEDLSHELEATRAILEDLAAALGACPNCFGADPACRWCRGRGRPGFMPPDPAAFQDLVVPAVALFVRLRGRVTNESTKPPTHGGRVP